MTNRYLDELFDRSVVDPRLAWHCEPATWAVETGRRCLTIQPAGGTDFWQKTHYRFEADNGHFLFAEVVGDFVLTTRVRSRAVHQYDQAGLMVRVSPSCWLKTSVEHEPDGPSRLGAVVTNCGYSDWSTQPALADCVEIWLRIRRESTDYIVDASDNGQDWEQIRMTHLDEDRSGASVACGIYACSPKAAGYSAEFGFMRIDTGRLD